MVTTPVDGTAPSGFYEAIGYRVLGERAVRVDILDRVALRLMRLARRGPFAIPADLASVMGLAPDQTEAVVTALGYRRSADGATFERPARRRRARDDGQRRPSHGTDRSRRTRRGSALADSPFARLAELRLPS